MYTPALPTKSVNPGFFRQVIKLIHVVLFIIRPVEDGRRRTVLH